jgi:cobalamin biosynthesis protein CobD/CbiB
LGTLVLGEAVVETIVEKILDGVISGLRKSAYSRR